MKHPHALVFLICLIVSGFLPSALWAGDSVIIGATPQQERFLTCVAQISADDLRGTPHSDERLTVVILEPPQIFGNARGLSCAQDETCLLQLAGQKNLSLFPYVQGSRYAAAMYYP